MNAETIFRPYTCPEKTYCLGGINTNQTDENDFQAPQPCPHGQYCKEASTSPFGTGRCPAGGRSSAPTAGPAPPTARGARPPLS